MEILHSMPKLSPRFYAALSLPVTAGARRKYLRNWRLHLDLPNSDDDWHSQPTLPPSHVH